MTSNPLSRRSAIFCAMAWLTQRGVRAQTVQAFEVIQPTRLPHSIRERFLRMGKRLQRPDNARITYAGTLRDARGERPVEIALQNPGWIRITEGGGVPRITAFDGVRVNTGPGGAAPEQTRLLETALTDLPEAIFQQIAAGEAWRRIGNGHRVPNTSPAEFVDVFQMLPRGPAAKALPNGQSAKIIAFDSSTRLLKFVSYRRPGGVLAMSRFEDWRTSGGEQYPALIRRLENGVEVLRITVQALGVGARLAANLF